LLTLPKATLIDSPNSLLKSPNGLR